MERWFLGVLPLEKEKSFERLIVDTQAYVKEKSTVHSPRSTAGRLGCTKLFFSSWSFVLASGCKRRIS
jgi:hypothetical protein